MTALTPATHRTEALLPPGLRGARARVLVELKKTRGLTARELSQRLGISLNAVRHHLKELEAVGFIQYERKHAGVGAPAFAYTLTPAGQALFPRRYEATLTELLDHVVEREGREGVVAVLEARYDNLRRRVESNLAGAGPAERLAAVAQLLSDEGYMAEGLAVEQGQGPATGTLVEHNCAIQAVAERFPEICAAEARFLAAVLGAEVERREHILSGCSACEYRVRFAAPESAGAGQPVQENMP